MGAAEIEPDFHDAIGSLGPDVANVLGHLLAHGAGKLVLDLVARGG